MLKMMNEPTTSPTAANPTNAKRRLPTPWRTGSARSSASFAAGHDLEARAERRLARLLETAPDVTPGSVVT